MPFKYHPPTRKDCDLCDKLDHTKLNAIIHTSKGKASAADNFPIHNWYNFVLGYTPDFPEYVLEREKMSKTNLVLDPFMGSGTTLVVCKSKGIPSVGVDANDFFKLAADVKLNWKTNLTDVERIKEELRKKMKKELDSFNWKPYLTEKNKIKPISGTNSVIQYAKKYRPDWLPVRYMSDSPFVQIQIMKNIIDKRKWESDEVKNFFNFAFGAITLPASNISYGPGFGVKKAKLHVDVLDIFIKKIDRMIKDIEILKPFKSTKSEVILGDARKLSSDLKLNSVDLIITSPPYPGDHEYTKHTKVELLLLGYAQTLEEFRKIKKRMLVGSTTNIYKESNHRELIKHIPSIKKVIDQIDERLKADKATSGFEKLYTKLVGEYFGGMSQVFEEAYKVLKPGGKFSLLVSDSHAFKMVHIETAKLLGEVAADVGFKNIHIELWQYKNSTSHKYKLLENILTVQKPKNAK
jgi:DNA modification methylase